MTQQDNGGSDDWNRGWMAAHLDTEVGRYYMEYRRDGSFIWWMEGDGENWSSSFDGARIAVRKHADALLAARGAK